jgi:hypothetical protein
MPATTYQVNRDLRQGSQTQREAFAILSSLADNATGPAYQRTIQDVSLDGAGRLRLRISDALPAEEVASFGGDIIAI